MFYNSNVFAGSSHFVWPWLVVLIIAAAAGCESPDGDESSTKEVAPGTAGTVTVEIDFNGRKQNKEFQIACNQDSTVFSILQQAENKGDVKFVFSGSGETAFVSSIDDIENEKAAGDNWTYKVNGDLADRSCGVFPVKTGDKILWRFGKYP